MGAEIFSCELLKFGAKFKMSAAMGAAIFGDIIQQNFVMEYISFNFSITNILGFAKNIKRNFFKYVWDNL